MAIDGSDLPAYANGQRYVSKGGRKRGPEEYSDPEASWGHRAAVEREFGRLEHEWALGPLRVRGLERVALHADLTILAKLACALARSRAVPAVA